MISYWWNLNSAFHVSSAPWSGAEREVGEEGELGEEREVAGRNAISAQTGKAVHHREKEEGEEREIQEKDRG
jgi:hypothetical protein